MLWKRYIFRVSIIKDVALDSSASSTAGSVIGHLRLQVADLVLLVVAGREWLMIEQNYVSKMRLQ